MNNSTYHFPGVHPFIEAVAARTGRDLHQVGRTRQLWHVAQIQDALGQMPRLDAASQAESLAHVRRLRDGLALALEGVDAAITEVVTTVLPPISLADTKPIKRRA